MCKCMEQQQSPICGGSDADHAAANNVQGFICLAAQLAFEVCHSVK